MPNKCLGILINILSFCFGTKTWTRVSNTTWWTTAVFGNSNMVASLQQAMLASLRQAMVASGCNGSFIREHRESDTISTTRYHAFWAKENIPAFCRCWHHCHEFVVHKYFLLMVARLQLAVTRASALHSAVLALSRLFTTHGAVPALYHLVRIHGAVPATSRFKLGHRSNANSQQYYWIEL